MRFHGSVVNALASTASATVFFSLLSVPICGEKTIVDETVQWDLVTASNEIVKQTEFQGILLNSIRGGYHKTNISPAKNCNPDPDVGILACDEPDEYCKIIGDGIGECVPINDVSVDKCDVSLRKKFDLYWQFSPISFLWIAITVHIHFDDTYGFVNSTDDSKHVLTHVVVQMVLQILELKQAHFNLRLLHT